MLKESAFRKWRQRLPLAFSLLAGLVAFFAATAHVAKSQDMGRTYDWIVQIRTEQLKNFLDHPTSSLKPVIKATITYSPTTGGGTTAYEDLFYKSWDVLGMRRYKDLALGTNDQIAIQVIHKEGNGSPEENAAAANAILRIFVDAYLKGNAVSNIIVPDRSLAQISQNLQRGNFYPGREADPDQPVFSTIVLRLESSPPGTVQMMYYAAETR